MLINFEVECSKYCHSYYPFCENIVPIVSWKPFCVEPRNIIYTFTFYMKNKQNCIISFFDSSIHNGNIPRYNLYIGGYATKFLRMRYLKNRLKYGADILYTVFVPYEGVSIDL